MRLLKVQRIIQRVQQENIKVASLEIVYDTAPGSVIAAAHSISDDHNQVFRVPLGIRSVNAVRRVVIRGTSKALPRPKPISKTSPITKKITLRFWCGKTAGFI
jgi:hypothetical protein